jgi:cytosine/adenosine deaminase-related metal-dependent hydrolase
MATAPVPGYGLRGRVVTMDASRTILSDGIVWVADGSISDVTAASGRPPAQAGSPVIPTAGTIYPGMIELHNHLAYNTLPLVRIPRLYTKREDWQTTIGYRRYVSGPAGVIASVPELIRATIRYVECKSLIAGTTTSQGITLRAEPIKHLYPGIVRKAESPGVPGLDSARAKVGDVTPDQLQAFGESLAGRGARLLHLAVGLPTSAARQHFLDLQAADGAWAITPEFVGIHATGLTGDDLAVVAQHGGSIVWSPFSDLMLFGATADVATAMRLGIKVSLGSDWSPTGSKNLLNELKVAEIFSGDRQIGLTDQQLVEMVTVTPAQILGWQGLLGSIEPGKLADLTVIAGRTGDPYGHLVGATEGDIRLVVVGGTGRYGTSALLGKLSPVDERFDVAGQPRAFHLDTKDPDPVLGPIALGDAASTLADALEHLPGRGADARSFASIAVPIRLDPLATQGDDAFFAMLANLANLPEAIRTELPGRYGETPRSPAEGIGQPDDGASAASLPPQEPTDRPEDLTPSDRSPVVEHRELSDELAGDLSADLVKPDEGIPADRDYLAMSTYVGMFASVIAYSKTPLPLSIGLFGEWGSGKSYFMGLLRDRIKMLAGSESPDYCHDIVQIGFNAWSYADSNLWASLGDEIFRQLAGPAATDDGKRADALNKELQETLERATELKAAKKKAEDEAAQLHADLAAARNDYSSSLKALVQATVQTSASSVLGEAWSRLGVTNEAEQVEILLDETRGIQTDSVALHRALGRHRLFFLGILGVVGAGLLLAPLWAGEARALLSTVGATALLAGAVFATTALRKVRSALRTVSAEAIRINARIEQNADEKFADEVVTVRQANARRQVIQAQLDEVLSRAGELGRELVDINPGQRLYTFLSERAASSDYRGQLGLISTIRKDFQQLIKLMEAWRKQPDNQARRPIDRIVLYIDDLDRCSPEQVAAVLQAVHLLLALDLFVVVVGVDPRWLLHSLRQQYQRMLAAEPETFEGDEQQLWASTPGDYLEKIFNIPFVLPAMTPDTFKSLIENLATSAAEADYADSDSESGTPVGSPTVDAERPEATGEESSDAETATEPSPTEAPSVAAPVEQTVTLLQAEEGSEVAAHDAATRRAEGNDPAPILKPRPLTEDELQLIYALAPMIGTPREAKRLFNLYRMLRSTFLGTAGEPGQYQAAAMLLGLLTAYPRLLGQMLWAPPDEEQQLHGGLCARAPDGMTWVQFLDSLEPEEKDGRWRNAVSSQLNDADRDQWSRLVSAARLSADLVQLPNLSAFRYWADHVARFSFVLSTMGATPHLASTMDQG